MKRLSCLFILAVIFCVSANAQSNDNFKKLQEMSLDPIYQENTKSKPNPSAKPQSRQEQIELGVNDSIFKVFDVDIDLTLGEISFDTSWGDPVENPKIRRNRASNLFGPVRHYADGSKRNSCLLCWERGGFDGAKPSGLWTLCIGYP